MITYTPTQYNNILSKLPQEVRDVVMSMDTTKHLWKIGEKHNLHVDKVGNMHDLAMDVMMGIVATKDFVKELQDTLQIGALEASVLARDIDENIFKPIKETMIHLYAGRAPYKPSSSLVQYYEEDDEHPALDQATLLKEIEDPTPSQVKKEATVIVGKVVRELGGKEIPNKSTASPTHELVEYHEEISEQPVGKSVSVEMSKKESEIIPPPATSYLKRGGNANNLTTLHTDTLRPDASNILNQIASLKLNQAFVMPKGAEGIQELRSLEEKGKGLSAVRKEAVSLGEKTQSSGLASKADELKSLEALGAKSKENEIIAPRPTGTPLILRGEEIPKANPNQLTNLPTNQLNSKIDPYREKI